MIISSKRYQEIQKIANRLAFSFKLLLYPVNVLLYVEKLENCVAVRYSRVCADFFAGDMEAFSGYACSADGYTDYLVSEDKYIIYYNDGILEPWSDARMRWTLAHELGHVILGHHILYGESGLRAYALEEETLLKLDAEADLFASELLAPLPLLLAMDEYERKLDLDSIARHFGISRKAAMSCRKKIDKKKWYLEQYRISPEEGVPYYKDFSRIFMQLVYQVTPVTL